MRHNINNLFVVKTSACFADAKVQIIFERNRFYKKNKSVTAESHSKSDAKNAVLSIRRISYRLNIIKHVASQEMW